MLALPLPPGTLRLPQGDLVGGAAPPYWLSPFEEPPAPPLVDHH